MNSQHKQEAQLSSSKNVLVVLPPLTRESVPQDFFGNIVSVNDAQAAIPLLQDKTVYLCGDIDKIADLQTYSQGARKVYIVSGLSSGYENYALDCDIPVIAQGRLPLNVHGVGVLLPSFFDTGLDYFRRISSEHEFQSLTESTKPGTAKRTGIYLTSVHKSGDDLNYRLLRCSSNLSGPTENLSATDTHIVDDLNQQADDLFEQHAPLNHVLAQVYHNTAANKEHNQSKAKIKAHADKTKDMPDNGIMAFCTFYDQLNGLNPLAADSYDYGHKSTSGLTRLYFRLKPSVLANPNNTFEEIFSVTLYPDSVFFMPLSTNRLYTHETRPSALDAGSIPTRLGYVVRCSSTEAVHKAGSTYLKLDDHLSELQEPSEEGMHKLRKLYSEQNKNDNFIEYGNEFPFSMNSGDYLAPTYQAKDEFRQYEVPLEMCSFDELQASIEFESMGKGRHCAVLVKEHDELGTPIVRTTTRYEQPAQNFQVIHKRLAELIQKYVPNRFSFNNALAEVYSNEYAKMGFHSDQAQDLQEDTTIAVFSCYKHPDRTNPPRMLKVESKDDSSEAFEISLKHNTVTVFSLDTNRRYKHKIVLDTSAHREDNEWLGITFRVSKTFVHYRDNKAYMKDGTELTIANEEQKNTFFPLRSKENKETNFRYPNLSYTVSESDLQVPVSGSLNK